jgi:hypothetical protein
MLATKRIQGPRECVGDGQPCDRCGTVVAAEFRYCTIDMPVGNRLTGKPRMRLCLPCIGALETAGATVAVIQSPAERRAAIKLVRPGDRIAGPAEEDMPELAAAAERIPGMLITAVQNAAEYMLGKSNVSDKTKSQVTAIVAKALRSQCERIIKASERQPDVEAAYEKQADEKYQARKKLAGELKAGRKKLAALKVEIAATEQALGSSTAMLAARQMQIPAGVYPAVPAPMFTPSNEGSGLPEISGVYFLWAGDVVEYVGQSIKLASRVRLPTHHRLRTSHRISYIPVDERDLDWAECWYIGALRPNLNFGSRAARLKAAPSSNG